MTKPVDLPQNRAAALRLLIRWIQHEGGMAPGAGSTRLNDIADTLGLSRQQLNRFLHQDMKSDEEARRADEIAEVLKTLLEHRADLPPPILQTFEYAFGAVDEVLPKDAVVTDQAVLRMRSMMADEVSDASPLFGLHMLVRQSNEFVRDEQGNEARGWSMSLLNIPPKYVQHGRHHPVFRLSQISKARYELVVQGIALVRKDRLVLQGLDSTNHQPMTAIMAIPGNDPWPAFHQGESHLSGVMLGLNRDGGSFGGLFNLFAIPNSRLSATAGPAAEQRFDALHRDAHDAAGVRTLAQTLHKLRSLGIRTSEQELLLLKQRALDGPHLSLF